MSAYCCQFSLACLPHSWSAVQKSAEASDKQYTLNFSVTVSEQPRSSGATSGNSANVLRGLAEHELKLGTQFATGAGVARSLPQAFHHYERALHFGHPEALLQAGIFFCDGFNTVAIDDARALKLFERAHQLGVRGSAYWLGVFLSNGFGSGRDEAQARRLWASDAADDPFCAFSLSDAAGNNASGGGDKIVARLEQLASAGDLEAPYLAAFAFQHGKGVRQDFAQGFKYAQMAASQGHATAQNMLGFFHQHGHGCTHKDEKRAVELYRAAAEQGERNAMYNLSVCFQHGIGVGDRDAALAVHWRFRAAELGDPVVQTDLGVIYRNGLLGVEKNLAKAAEWLKKASDAGHEDARVALRVL